MEGYEASAAFLSKALEQLRQLWERATYSKDSFELGANIK